MSDAAAAASAGPSGARSASEARLAQRDVRSCDPSPIERLLDEPHRFEFHQAVRLLQAWQRGLPDDARPLLRFRNTLSLSFPPSEIAGIDTEARSPAEPDQAPVEGRAPGGLPDLARIEVTPAFMGLLGALGALPLAYTEQFAQRESHGRDGTARAFLDIFQHRAVSLFHEAWRKHRLPLQFERERRAHYLPRVLSLLGLGEPSLQRRLHADRGGVADDALAYYAGLLQRRAVSADHLQSVLADYFGVPVRVTQFVGRWFALDGDCQVALGDRGSRLGHNTVLGPRVWQRDLCARIAVGPMARAQHRRFLPGGPAALALKELLSLVSGVSVEYEVCLALRAADVAGIRLDGAAPAKSGGARLGWDSYLLSGTCGEDCEDTAYRLHALAA